MKLQKAKVGKLQILGGTMESHRRKGGETLRFFYFILIGLALICSWSVQLNAKVVAGVSGTVTDASGAVVSGATVQMKAIETGAVETRETNSEGFYAFVNLQPGHYDLEVKQTGFTTYRQTGIVLDVDSAKILNITMKLGQVSEQVVVRAYDCRCAAGDAQLYRSACASAWGGASVFWSRWRSRRAVQRHRVHL
jgi:hypothetical protein